MPLMYDTVEIIWRDATTEAGWLELNKLDKLPQKIRSVGQFVKEDSNGVWISLDSYRDCEGNYQFGTVQFIPRGCIDTVNVLDRFIERNSSDPAVETTEWPR